MERVESWAEGKQMKLNILKTKNIIFNYSSDKKFSTDIRLRNDVIETVSEAKLKTNNKAARQGEGSPWPPPA